MGIHHKTYSIIIILLFLMKINVVFLEHICIYYRHKKLSRAVNIRLFHLLYNSITLCYSCYIKTIQYLLRSILVGFILIQYRINWSLIIGSQLMDLFHWWLFGFFDALM
jgi:hypothetical protein